MVFSYNATILYPKMDNKMDSIKQKCINKKLLSDTLKVYQKAVSYIINVIEKHYDDIKDLKGNYTILVSKKFVPLRSQRTPIDS